MTDPRIKTLAKNLIGFSCAVKPGEKILIEGNGECTELVKALVKETYAAGGVPFVWIKKPEVCRELALGATKEQQELMAKIDCELMRHMDAYIGIGAKLNTNEMSDVPGDKLALISAVYGRPLNNIRIPNTKWCVLRYPNPNFAQMAGMTQLNALRRIGFQMKPVELIAGHGETLGRWYLASVSEDQSDLMADGAPRKQTFTVEFKRYGDDYQNL